jgi:hypothetical protein
MSETVPALDKNLVVQHKSGLLHAGDTPRIRDKVPGVIGDSMISSL